jgi:copper homeostasis protein
VQTKLSLEICVESLESALAAERGGAQRIELCSALSEGGLTPSAGLIAACSRLAVECYVMIRPHGGDFLYSDLEFELMKDEIQRAKELGADGVVFGILTADGRVDVERTRALVELAAPLPVTYHRAFDMTPDLDAALEAVIATGAVRILTSGGAPSVPEGLDAIAWVVQRAAGRIRIMPGGGVKPGNIAEIARMTGATEFHSSARDAYPSAMVYRKPGIAMGDFADREYTLYASRKETVRALAEALTHVATR